MSSFESLPAVLGNYADKGKLPKPLAEARAFAAAVEDYAASVAAGTEPDVTAVTAKTIAATVDAVVAFERDRSARLSVVPRLREIAAEREDRAWIKSFGEFRELWKAEFARCASNLVDAVRAVAPVTWEQANGKDHDGTYAAVRDAVREFHRPLHVRNAFAHATGVRDSDLDEVWTRVLRFRDREAFKALHVRPSVGRGSSDDRWLVWVAQADGVEFAWLEGDEQKAHRLELGFRP